MFFTLKNILLFFENPHKNFSYLHITGTKGKTSLSYYCYQMLLKQNKKVGIFVSPHVYHYRERIQCNGYSISHKDYQGLKDKVIFAEKKLNLQLNFFERYLVIAFLYFQKMDVQYVVLEVGIGGSLDSTNIITPMISIISTIEKDHEKFLGKRLSSIVKNKLGIIKDQKPYIIGKQSFFVSFLIFFQTFFKRKYRLKCLPYSFKKCGDHFYQLKIDHRTIDLKGPLYMVSNFVLAYSALKALNLKPLEKDSFFNHKVSGRFEVLESQNQTMVLDGAHNPIAFKILFKSLKDRFYKKKWTAVLIVKKDKPIKRIVKQLKSKVDRVIIPSFYLEFGDVFNPDLLIYWLKRYKIPFLLMDQTQLIDYISLQNFILVSGSFYHLKYFKLIFYQTKNR